MNDVRKMIYGILGGFLFVLVAWFSFVYVSACGFSFSCPQGAPKVIRTPIPTLIPVAHAAPQLESNTAEFNQCQVGATDLIGAWVSAGYPNAEPFPFEDVNGQPCTGTYEDDIQPLFMENNLWSPTALGCTSCHNADLTERSAGLDLTSYEAILLGSRREPGSSSPATDILGKGEWEASLLYEVLVNQGLVPAGHSPDASPTNPIIYAGVRVVEEATPTP
ncbi:MAG TPA: hypothetical protein VNK49_15075 [Anaerolineales bacterium]|nr:hypothetical protein [Anaerolineales bacterium]